MPTYSSASESYPLLAISSSEGGKRDGLPAGFASVKPAARTQQSSRLSPRFAALSAAMDTERLRINDDIAGHDPELVIVLEVNATLAEFARAVSLVPGLEFLAELVEDQEDPEFGVTTPRAGQLVDRTMYVLAQNAKALQQIQRLWDQWKTEASPKFARGLAPWKQVFALLKDVRPWGPSDRIAGTQLEEAWGQSLARGDADLVAEVELWFRRTASARDRAEELFIAELRVAGCEILDIAQIESIAYHAILIRVDADLARATLDEQGFLVNNARVSQVRPQMIGSDHVVDTNLDQEGASASAPVSDAEPLVAVLDAMPLTGHQLLASRLIVDDPNQVSNKVQAQDRVHGSAVASLVIWGDLERGREDSVGRKVYTQPLFTTGNGDGANFEESMPSDRLAVAVMNDILTRMYIGTSDTPPSAASVRVIVLTAGHTALPFGSKISPWARLLDVFASRFDILFIVSAGNYSQPIELDPQVGTEVLDDKDQLQRQVRKHLLENAHERRILSPADSLNALTIGALHADSVTEEMPATALDVIGSALAPSPASAIGGGYLRAMKPDLFADGGRVLYRHRFDRTDRIVLDVIESSNASPGLLSATPGLSGETAAEGHLRGTSAAAAFVGHEAAQVVELLAGDSGSPLVPPRYLGIATKALVANAASWQSAESMIEEAMTPSDRGALRRDASRLFGFGFLRPDEVALCGARKITVVATGAVIADGSRDVYMPVPLSLNGRRDVRRVIATLAWFTPVNPRQKSYRQARVWFDISNGSEFGVSGMEGEWRATRRGSLQHEIFSGDRAVTIGRDAALHVRVNCMGAAGGVSGAVPFALALTFEVDDSSDIRVYQEISTALQSRATVQGARARVRT
ncbi:S8 family peptidase [Microbacterium sp. TWP3-1-2b2]|uniref:S8 family peptidase n=1 Tax=Microbacterium sp. TWP3-1-2b2 TaxID=2804651 RepID=UPI003CFA4E4C